MQVDPIKPTLKAPGTKPLKLKYGKLVSNFAFNFNLRRYIKALTQHPAFDIKNPNKVGRCRLTLSNPS